MVFTLGVEGRGGTQESSKQEDAQTNMTDRAVSRSNRPGGSGSDALGALVSPPGSQVGFSTRRHADILALRFSGLTCTHALWTSPTLSGFARAHATTRPTSTFSGLASRCHEEIATAGRRRRPDSSSRLTEV